MIEACRDRDCSHIPQLGKFGIIRLLRVGSAAALKRYGPAPCRERGRVMEFGYFTLSDNHYKNDTLTSNQFITDEALYADSMHSAFDFVTVDLASRKLLHFIP
jgi:hypothetical protein